MEHFRIFSKKKIIFGPIIPQIGKQIQKIFNTYNLTFIETNTETIQKLLFTKIKYTDKKENRILFTK